VLPGGSAKGVARGRTIGTTKKPGNKSGFFTHELKYFGNGYILADGWFCDSHQNWGQPKGEGGKVN